MNMSLTLDVKLLSNSMNGRSSRDAYMYRAFISMLTSLIAYLPGIARQKTLVMQDARKPSLSIWDLAYW